MTNLEIAFFKVNGMEKENLHDARDLSLSKSVTKEVSVSEPFKDSLLITKIDEGSCPMKATKGSGPYKKSSVNEVKPGATNQNYTPTPPQLVSSDLKTQISSLDQFIFDQVQALEHSIKRASWKRRAQDKTFEGFNLGPLDTIA